MISLFFCLSVSTTAIINQQSYSGNGWADLVSQSGIIPSVMITIQIREGPFDINDFKMNDYPALTTLEIFKNCFQDVLPIDSFIADDPSLTTLIVAGATGIGEECLMMMTHLTTLECENCKSIGNNALPPSITTIDLPNLETIGLNNFNGTGIKEFNCPKLLQVHDSCFADCKQLTTFSAPLLKNIPEHCFSGCNSLSSIDISAAETIGNFSFEGLPELKSLVLKSCKYVYSFAFHDSSIESIDLTNCLSIGSSAFMSCTKLTEIKLSKILELTGDSNFMRCSSLKSIDLSGISNLPSQAFSSCTKLEVVNFSSLESLLGDHHFYECYSLVYINLSLVKVLPDSIFSGCSNLETVVLNSVINITGDSHFDGCRSLKELNLTTLENVPENSTKIFNRCSSLSMITFGEIPPERFNNETFSSLPQLKISILSDWMTYFNQTTMRESDRHLIWCGYDTGYVLPYQTPAPTPESTPNFTPMPTMTPLPSMTPFPSPSPSDIPSNQDGNSQRNKIILYSAYGAAGLVFIILVVVVVCCIVKCKSNNKDKETTTTTMNDQLIDGPIL